MSTSEGHPRQGSDPTARAESFWGTLRRFLAELRAHRLRMIVALAATFASVAVSVAAPMMLGRATDLLFSGMISRQVPPGATAQEAAVLLRSSGHERFADMVEAMEFTPGAGVDFDSLGFLLMVVVGMYIVSALFSLLTGMVLRNVVQRTAFELRERVQRKIDRLPLSYIDRNSRGDLMSRVSNDVDNVAQVMNQTLSQFLQSMLTVIGIIVMMLSISWRLTVLSLVVLPVGMGLVAFLMVKAQPYFRSQWKHTGELSGIVEDSMTGHEVALLYGLEDRFADKMRESNQALHSSAVRAQFVSNLVMPIMNMISSATYVVVAVGGGILVANGSMTLGSVQAFIQYSRQFMHPLGTLASMMSSLQSGAASAERVFDLLDAEEMSDELFTATVPSPVRGRVVFDDVRFGYEAGKPVIKDLSLTVEPGQMVAIIGPTGAGKTTLVNLLMRFYEVDSGRITLDGVDIRDISRDELRAHMGMVLQETWLFDGTIRDNIAFGRGGASEGEVIAAAEATGVDRLVRHLPEGYSTHVTDESDSLSVGERQLLTIARAFVSQPDILILDEATSSVDTRTEVLVQKAMDRLRQGRTAFVIAHRLSTIRDADVILVMEDGDVVEMGSHEELVAAGGAYTRLQTASHGVDSDTEEA